MLTKVSNFFVEKLDTLCIRLHRDDIIFHDTSFFEKLVVINSETGEELEDLEMLGRPKKVFSKKGISFRMRIERDKSSYAYDKPTNLVIIWLSAKQLRERYFEGITKHNIELIRKDINSHGLIEIPKKAFMQADFFDFDVAIDIELNQDEYRECVLDYLPKIANINSGKDTKQRFNSKEKGLGYQWNSRQNHYPSKPFFKTYDKTRELNSKSLEFADWHLKGVDIDNIIRFEYNIRNKEYMRHWELNGIRTLERLLDWFETDEPHKLTQKVYANWFTLRRVIPSVVKKNRKDILIFSLMQMLSLEEINTAFYWAQDSMTKKQKRDFNEKDIPRIMTPEKQKYHESRRIEIANKLDDFFGVAKRTNDVREKVPKLGKTNPTKWDGEWLENNHPETVKARKEMNKINKENAKNEY